MNIKGLDQIMNPAIEKLSSGAGVAKPQVAGPGGTDFAHTLMDVMKEVNDSQQHAAGVQNDFMSGRQKVDIHDLEIAMERASLSMNLTLSVRNKLLEAYQEISRMQI